MDIGATAESHHVVGRRDTAVALGSGDVSVLATPRLLAWCEAATLSAVHVAPDQTSVGTEVHLQHVLPSPVGADLVIRATLTEHDRNRLTFDVVALHSTGEVAARGLIRRAIVSRSRFDERVP